MPVTKRRLIALISVYSLPHILSQTDRRLILMSLGLQIFCGGSRGRTTGTAGWPPWNKWGNWLRTLKTRWWVRTGIYQRNLNDVLWVLQSPVLHHVFFPPYYLWCFCHRSWWNSWITFWVPWMTFLTRGRNMNLFFSLFLWLFVSELFIYF